LAAVRLVLNNGESQQHLPMGVVAGTVTAVGDE
jgi:hypothetical protein